MFNDDSSYEWTLFSSRPIRFADLFCGNRGSRPLPRLLRDSDSNAER